MTTPNYNPAPDNPSQNPGTGSPVRPKTRPVRPVAGGYNKPGSGRVPPVRPPTGGMASSTQIPPVRPPSNNGGGDEGSNEEYFQELVHDLNHVIWEVRRNAAEDLGALVDQRAVPYLIQHLSDTVGGVRFAIVEALGKISDSRAVPPLLRLLDDPTFGAYGPVIEALANMKSVEAIPYFIRFLRDPDPRIRGLAHNSLMVMTRQFIPFKAKGSDEEREAAVQQWETWWAQNAATFRLPGI